MIFFLPLSSSSCSCASPNTKHHPPCRLWKLWQIVIWPLLPFPLIASLYFHSLKLQSLASQRKERGVLSICSSISRQFYPLFSQGGLRLLPCQEKELAKSSVAATVLLRAGIGAVLRDFLPVTLQVRAVLVAHFVGRPETCHITTCCGS